jgi:hypothetical protein
MPWVFGSVSEGIIEAARAPHPELQELGCIPR